MLHIILRFCINCLFSFFFLLRIFGQKNIFASQNLEITSHFAKCEAIIRTLHAKQRNRHSTYVKQLHYNQNRFTLTPFVDEQWWRFCVSWFDPWWEQTAFVSFIPQILIEVRICDFLEWFNIKHWHEVTVQIHEFNTNLYNNKHKDLNQKFVQPFLCHLSEIV